MEGILQMERILQMEKLWKALTKKWDDPTSEQRKAKMKKLAYAHITFRLSNDVARQVIQHKDPKVLSESLDETFFYQRR